MVIRKGGKADLEEIKVTENAEEHKAKDYALALERMQNALKREKQIKIVKQMNEKHKMNVSLFAAHSFIIHLFGEKSDFLFQ